MANEDVRRYAKYRGVPQWKIAEHLGISEPTLGRRLRHEFDGKEREKYMRLIDEIGGVKNAES